MFYQNRLLASLILENILKMHLQFCSDVFGTKSNNVIVAVLVYVAYSTKADFEGHATVTESVAV